MKALIVEDDYVSRTVLRRILAVYGEVAMAGDGEGGIDAFSTAQKVGNPFNLVCLDIMLPKIDGLAVLQKIRALEAAHPAGAQSPSRIIMTTALSHKWYVDEAIKYCDGYLVKPYQKERIIEYIIRFGFDAK